jgi:hypothetical protein
VTKYEGQKFTKATFVLEDSFFVNCVITDCDVFYSGGDFDWVNSKFENCRWHWRGPVPKTMQLLSLLGLLTAQPTLPLQTADKSKLN